MDFSFDVNLLFPSTITRIVGGRSESIRKAHKEWFSEVVNRMGHASARAQGIRVPITTYQKLIYNNDILYILKGVQESGRGVVLGILKVGKRKLFLNDISGIQHEVEPISVLDFYVHESTQRSGCGKKLFEAMIEEEEVKPFELAIDRPSTKFLAFLKKHYGLCSYMRQANHYVVCDQFFKTCKDLRNTRKSSKLEPISQQFSSHYQISNHNNDNLKITPSNSLNKTKSTTETVTMTTPSSQEQGTTLNSTLPVPLDPPLRDEPKPVISKSIHRLPDNFNWTPDCVKQSGNRSQQGRLSVKNRNIITGCEIGRTNSPGATKYSTTNIGSKHWSYTTNAGNAVMKGDTAPFLKLREGRNTYTKLNPILCSHNTSYDHSYERFGFAKPLVYSRYGQLGESGRGRDSHLFKPNNRVEGNLLDFGKVGTQSTYNSSRSKLKDSWKQFIA